MSLAFVEGLYEDYLRDPARCRTSGATISAASRRTAVRPRAQRSVRRFTPSSIFNPTGNGHARAAHTRTARHGNGNGSAALMGVSEAAVRQDQVDALVRAYRVRGHMIAKIDPLGLPRPTPAGARPGVLRPRPDRPRSQVLEPHHLRRATCSRCARSSSGCATPTAARSACSSCTSTTCSVRELAAGAHGGHREPHPALAATSSCASSRRLTDAVDLRGVHPEEVRGRQELLARRARRA